MGIGARTGIGVVLVCCNADPGSAATKSYRFEVRATVVASCAANPALPSWKAACLPAPSLSPIAPPDPQVRLLREGDDGVSKLVIEF